MSRTLTATALLAILAACDNANPFQDVVTGVADPTDPVTEEQQEAIESLAGNLTSVSFAPGSNTITMSGLPLDQVGGSFPEAVFTLNTNLSVPGYVAYAYQDDNLDRMFVMLIAEDASGGAQAGAVADGGQFADFFGGGFYRQVGDYPLTRGWSVMAAPTRVSVM